MIFNRDILFVHVPRTGGMAATRYLLQVLPRPVYCSLPATDDRIADSGVVQIPGSRHEGLCQAREVVARYGFDVARFPLILGVVRNPYALEVSRYTYLQKGHPWDCGHNQKLAIDEDFETFAVESYDHAGPERPIQTYFELEGALLPNMRVLRSENLAEELPAVLRAAGIEVGDEAVPRANESAHGSWESYYTRTAEEAVYRRYRWVFVRGLYPRLDRETFPFAAAPPLTGPALPIAGPVRQVGTASGLSHAGWVGKSLPFRVRPGEPVGGLVVEGQLPSVNCDRNCISNLKARLIAFYLPQFHPIPENDEWWGKGFTEWTNVSRARPLFGEHYQPHIPANLGFYDLRVPEVRRAQADLAARHGIEAFCYWHYWFNGRRLIERPFDEVLNSGEPDFPFCLAWANETWSRRWLGEEKNILIKQTYSAEDDARHARWLARAFADPRYLRVEGRPLLLVYRPGDLPDAQATTTLIREECARTGLPNPFLVGIASYALTDHRTMGFDANATFEPHLGALANPLEKGLKTYDYRAARAQMLQARRGYPAYPCIMVSWDNTPRRGEEGIVFTNATPGHFAAGLRVLVEAAQSRPFEHRLVFVNAWNEWAEGNHLEPDLRHGLRYLEAVRQINGAP